ncbi:cytochrome oxidase small assembly protein [Denitromonas iodatirespirans]|nr:cytochrome oxidase small assembly protein [Denitromonas iodatirespirans]
MIGLAMAKGKNLRTALLLLLVALTFFFAIMVKTGWLGA